jgi:hypothetical protein
VVLVTKEAAALGMTCAERRALRTALPVVTAPAGLNRRQEDILCTLAVFRLLVAVGTRNRLVRQMAEFGMSEPSDRLPGWLNDWQVSRILEQNSEFS